MLILLLININHLWKVRLPRPSNLRKKLKDNKRITKKSSFRSPKMLKMKRKILRARMNKTRSRLMRCLLSPRPSCSWLRISCRILVLTLILLTGNIRTRILNSYLLRKKRRPCRLKSTRKRLILRKETSWSVIKRRTSTSSRRRPRS